MTKVSIPPISTKNLMRRAGSSWGDKTLDHEHVESGGWFSSRGLPAACEVRVGISIWNSPWGIQWDLLTGKSKGIEWWAFIRMILSKSNLYFFINYRSPEMKSRSRAFIEWEHLGMPGKNVERVQIGSSHDKSVRDVPSGGLRRPNDFDDLKMKKKIRF